ncbi:MAG TPA: hypothetical protein VHA57_05275 [Actinomycetota bacterium]|nr:hypothetical protein [Actinomycetota bacterium]
MLTDDEGEHLERWARRPKSGQALAPRCRIILVMWPWRTLLSEFRTLGVSPPSRTACGRWGTG